MTLHAHGGFATQAECDIALIITTFPQKLCKHPSYIDDFRLHIRFSSLSKFYAMTIQINAAPAKKKNAPPFDTPLSPKWDALLNLTPDRYSKSHLRRLFSLATYLNLEPEELSDETLERLEQAAITAGITRPSQVPRDAAKSWNKMGALHPQWPRQQLTPPEHRKFISIKFDQMPQAFREDVAQFFDTTA